MTEACRRCILRTMTTPEGNTPTLVGAAEVAEALGVPTTNVTTWMNRRRVNGCPEPIVQLKMGGVYDLQAWLDWHDEFSGKVRTRRQRRHRRAAADSEQTS